MSGTGGVRGEVEEEDGAEGAGVLPVDSAGNRPAPVDEEGVGVEMEEGEEEGADDAEALGGGEAGEVGDELVEVAEEEWAASTLELAPPPPPVGEEETEGEEDTWEDAAAEAAAEGEAGDEVREEESSAVRDEKGAEVGEEGEEAAERMSGTLVLLTSPLPLLLLTGGETAEDGVADEESVEDE